MSARQVEPQVTVLHPRQNTALFGHHDAERRCLMAIEARGWRMPG